jgi:hypothetical protein
MKDLAKVRYMSEYFLMLERESLPDRVKLILMPLPKLFLTILMRTGPQIS